ncbi:translin-like isoform X2 [Halichondria panicea]|uniref:translin-like isoform X2 n=1 Tax=Halichondria panicea TaxID=6063 RepID=UPI00312B4694
MTDFQTQESPAGECSSSEQVINLFSGLQELFDREQVRKEKIRTVVNEIEQSTRNIHTAIQAAHQCTLKDVPALCLKIRPMFADPKRQIQTLKELIPKDSYYRFNDQWKHSFQRLCFLSSFLVYLETEKLATKLEVATMLGVEAKEDDGFHLDLDDFLIGLLFMTNELPRLAVNSVILEDYQRPLAISTFLSDVTAGFRLLNLKNDFLRKKFDSLKYDVKKVEEVVYDVSIRKFK